MYDVKESNSKLDTVICRTAVCVSEMASCCT